MVKRNIAKELVESVAEIRSWQRGELKLKTYEVDLPKAADVPHIRKTLGLSQEQFASLMGVSVGTLRNWEQARREPHGAARSLLLVASSDPAAVRSAFEKLVAFQRRHAGGRKRRARPAVLMAKATRAAKAA